MAKEISINMNPFQSNISKLKKSAGNLNSTKRIGSFNRTNLGPFTKDLEQVMEAIDLLKQYKRILEKDIITLEKTGNSIRDIDVDLSKRSHSISGPQPIRS